MWKRGILLKNSQRPFSDKILNISSVHIAMHRFNQRNCSFRIRLDMIYNHSFSWNLYNLPEFMWLYSPNLFFYLNYLIPVFSFLSLTKKCTLLAKSQLAFWKLWNGLAMPNILFRWCNLLDAINILISEDQAIKRQARAKPEIWK